MHPRLLDWLVCPRCAGKLRLAGTQSNSEVDSGVLVCPAGHELEVRQGVPRLASSADAALSIQQTYDTAWSHFEYGDATWSKDAADRVKLFLQEVRLRPEELEGKLMLDAGCGTGVLTHGVTAYGCEAIGADVSEIVVRAHRHFGREAGQRAHFVQADLDDPPFRDGIFDIIYAGGVLHHNPDPQATFGSIARKLATGGRLWVWLYRKRSNLKYRLQQLLRACVVRLPRPAQKVAVAAWLPQSMLRQFVKIALGRCASAERSSWREKYVLLLDHYTPQYRWEHTEEQVRGWYEQAGFTDLVFSHNDWGFGVIGTKQK